MITFTAHGADIGRAFRAVLPHVAKDDHVASLGAVQVRSAGGRELAFAATNRYTLGTWSLALDEPVDAFEILVPGSEVTRLLKALVAKTRWTFTVDGDRCRVGDSVWTSITLGSIAGTAQFPGTAALIPSVTETDITGVSLDPRQLALFAKAARIGQPMRLSWGTKGATGPTVVRIGDQFVGLIMSKVER